MCGCNVGYDIGHNIERAYQSPIAMMLALVRLNMFMMENMTSKMTGKKWRAK
jgi:hypothetical protein